MNSKAVYIFPYYFFYSNEIYKSLDGFSKEDISLLFTTLYLNVLKLLLNLLERIKIPGFGSDRLVPPWEMIK